MDLINPTFSSSGGMNPIGYAEAVTPADVDFDGGLTRAIYVGVTGTLVLKMAGDEAIVTFLNVAAGVVHPLRCHQIMAASTASGLVACF
jgi:hypothetical protein